MDDQPTVLVVDDEPHILSFLEQNLTSDDFKVYTASCGAQARSRLSAYRPHIMLLDVMLPDTTGFELCREVRDQDVLHSRIDPDIPIIMLTARGEEVDRVRGFNRGADDYVLKPFHYPELLGRMSALLRRTRNVRERDVLQVAGISIDTSTRQVLVHGNPVELSAKEFLLLTALAREPRRVFKKQELLESVWGYRSVGSTRTLDSHASRIRKKLKPYAQGRDYIANVWGVGYRLVSIETPAA